MAEIVETKCRQERAVAAVERTNKVVGKERREKKDW